MPFGFRAALQKRTRLFSESMQEPGPGGIYPHQPARRSQLLRHPRDRQGAPSQSHYRRRGLPKYFGYSLPLYGSESHLTFLLYPCGR